ncbi:ATP-dependent helicase [Ruegeria sp. HKCCD6119]|uniref:ATP-dependent helicase n=1 Tax=Ruegeria sp. HKCCD6119 TaxID=2683003 RepID=UPI0014909C7A|nr:UvrD-helicase domain-containing protein [Ruegeria sp. HKCCD6119]NOD82782.1 UvrD-helicase domain-containing protein [Ruegeria sp. HKCCD6119]
MSSFDEMDAFEGASLSARAMAVRPSPYLDELNPAQRDAVERLDGPVLMLAGAGTGKTKALTARIAHLLNTARARPNEILSVTFTNKAAREMKERVGRLLGQPAEGMPWLGTFHSICVKLLRRHAELVDLKSNFTILDTDDQLRLLKQLVQAANIDDKRWPARMLLGVIDDWKNRALTPDKVPAADAGAYDNKGIELYAQYQTRLRELNAVDFGDLLLHMVTIFQTHQDVLEQYQRWFRYILVDEYQDTNIAQYLWLRLLAGGHKNICCVGDDDQSIYGWRGAEVGNILRFEKDFPGAYVVRLEQNYRSTPHILAAASNVIRGNESRLGKELWTAAENGEKVCLIGHWDGEEEARWIGEQIEDLVNGNSPIAKRRQNSRSDQMMSEVERLDELGALKGLNSREQVLEKLKKHESFLAEAGRESLIWELTMRQQEGRSLEAAFPRFYLDEIAILVRASHQMRAFEDRFLTIGLPYKVIGGPRFYERMEIRDAMAYFRLVVSPEDDLAFERIVNTPKRGLGDKAQQTIQMTARENGVSLVEGARIAVDNGLIKGKGGAALRELIDGLARWNAMTRGPRIEVDDDSVIDDGSPMRFGAPEHTHIELAQIILDESGYTAHWQNDKTLEAPGRLENLKELVNQLDNFENLQGFLEHVSLVMDNEQDSDGAKVSIMTLHAAKGLEFPAVFLPGWEDGLFPSQRSMDESGLKGLEEERRLAYVGITRAEEVCTISFAANRRVFGQWQNSMPSRFIDELPEGHVEVLTPPGLYGGGQPAAGIETRAAEANVYNSPGWRRMQARQGQYGMSQPRESRNTVIDATAVASFTLGERVFHQKFGYGAVVGIEGDKVEVEFDKAGTKKVVSRFLTNKDDIPF